MLMCCSRVQVSFRAQVIQALGKKWGKKWGVHTFSMGFVLIQNTRGAPFEVFYRNEPHHRNMLYVYD